MKIKRYELFQVPPRWLFLKIETDAGITGWGEPVIEGKAAAPHCPLGPIALAACLQVWMQPAIMLLYRNRASASTITREATCSII